MAKWLWPCPGNNTITSGVGPRWGSSHKGIDIGAPKGASIVATRAGKVIRSVKGYTKEHQLGNKDGGGYGNHVYVDHQDGYVTRYAHMTTVNVNEGDKVHAGQVLGTVGSTGSSTGYHLHFEIRQGDTILDPENYVSPSNSIVVDEKTSPVNSDIASNTGDINNSNSNDLSAIYNINGPVVPVTSSQFTNGRPIHAYCRIYLGEHELVYDHGKPNIFMSLELSRLEQAGSTGQLVIFDDNWDEIEYHLSQNWQDVRIQYGYSEGEIEGEIGISSPVYKLQILEYNIDFRDTGVIISMKVTSDEVIENLSEIGAIDTHTKNPAQAIRVICNYMGWSIDLANFAVTEDVDREETYKFTKDTAMNYIRNTILPEAVTKDGEILAFHVTPTVEKKAQLVPKSFTDLNDKKVRTYVYQKGYDSVVESISFDIKGVFGGTSKLGIVTEVLGDVLGAYDKSEYSNAQNTHSVLTGATGIYSHTRVGQASTRVLTAAETLNQLGNQLKYAVKNSAHQQYEATMTILGDPEIQLFEYIRIINMTEFGFLHHTSGIYQILGITDTIENGMYRTSLKVMRNCDINDGIELVNPKWLIK